MKDKSRLNKWKINFPELFITFIGLLVIGNAILLNELIILVIIIPLTYLVITCIDKWQKILGIGAILLIYTIILIFTKYQFNIAKLNEIINLKLPSFYQLRFKAINHINEIYNETKSGYYINMLIFNYRDKNSYEIYNLTKQINITHLITVSGLQINILLNIFKILFLRKFKNKLFSNFIELIICGLYAYFLAFSISILRILINTFIKLIVPKIKISHSNYYSGILIVFIFKNQVTNYGFLMSYLCVIGIWMIIKLISNKILLAILINLYCIMITLPFVVLMNGKFNIFAFFYNYMFSSILILEYVWLIFTCWFNLFVPLNVIFINQTISLIRINVSLGVYITFKNIQQIILVTYYLLWVSIGVFLTKNEWKCVKK